MRVSICVTNYTWPSGPARLGGELVWLARAAEHAGIDTLWVTDHLIQADPTAPPEAKDMLEAYTVLGFIAAHTERIRIGAMVSNAMLRAPALLVKAVTTLDALTGGRVWLGVGAGHHGGEAEAMGLPMPPASERLDRLEETLQIAARMWAEDDGTPYEGKYYRLARPAAAPAPTGPGRPPVLIGGTGRRRTLRLVAQYADACNVFDIPDEGRTVRADLDALAGHCEDVGRPYDEIEKTLSTRLGVGESSEAFVGRCATAAALGIEHMILITPVPWNEAALATLAAAIPEVGRL